MLFPKKIIDAVANTFYDKKIDILTVTDSLDAEGGSKRVIGSVSSSFYGNVRFSDLGEVKEELGLVESIDICITCRSTETITLNDLISYENKTYLVTKVIPTDSHLTITGKLWENQQ